MKERERSKHLRNEPRRRRDSSGLGRSNPTGYTGPAPPWMPACGCFTVGQIPSALAAVLKANLNLPECYLRQSQVELYRQFVPWHESPMSRRDCESFPPCFSKRQGILKASTVNLEWSVRQAKLVASERQIWKWHMISESSWNC